MLLSVCIVTGDKVKTIMRTINSVKKIADEIILLDNDSLDNTREVAKGLGVKVYHIKKGIGFCERHNLAKEIAGGKWILLLEGNEELLDDFYHLRTLLSNTDSTGFYLPRMNIGFTSKRKYKVDNSYTFPRLSLRLYQNKKEYRYTGDSYESITNSILKTDGEAFLKVLHFPIIRKNIYSIIPEEIRPLSLFCFEFGGDGDIILRDAVFKSMKDGIKRFWKGESSEAINKIEDAYSHASIINKAIILQNLLLVLLEDKQYHRVEEYIKIGLRNYPDNAIFIFWQGYLEYIKGKFSTAISCFKYILGLSIKNDISSKLRYNSYFLLGLSQFANNKKEEAFLCLEKAFSYEKENKLIINLLFEIKGMDIDDLFVYFQLDNPVNKKVLFALIECLFSRKEYQLLEFVIRRQSIIRNDENKLLYWQGLTYLKQEKYHRALKHLKMIKPDFENYENTLFLQWILNLIIPGRVESKSIINQIKLLGDKISWTIINYFNEIYFYEKELFFSFDHLLAKLKFYNRALYLLERLIEYSSSRSIIIMLELINNLKIPGSCKDVGLLFYIHGYWEEAYKYLKTGISEGGTLQEINIFTEICRKLGYFSEEMKCKEKFEHMDLYPEINIQCRKFAFFVEY